MHTSVPISHVFTGTQGVNRVAETHFMIRPALIRGLQQQVLTDAGRQISRTSAQTYAELWKESFGDRFFDMGTFIRLGSAVEQGLRHYYQQVSGTRQQGGIFQRLVDPTGIVDLFIKDCNYDLRQNSNFTRVREIMLHRHLFAHRSGLVDDKYIAQLKTITGEDISPSVAALGYPADDVYWFEPLKRLNPSPTDAGLIESARSFFAEMDRPPVTTP